MLNGIVNECNGPPGRMDISIEAVFGNTREGHNEWIGSSPDAVRIRREIATAAQSADAVLIEAEDGTGRRLVAELIHRSSPKAGANSAAGFSPIEAGNVPAGKLVPHLDAVATGARENGAGSGRWTLYLSGLDRAGLTDVGSLTAIPGIRLIASIPPVAKTPASGRRNAPSMPKAHGITTIRIAPLRERRMDISALALRFLTDACERASIGPYGISSRMIAAYHDYDWPGNAAELRAVIESAVATAALSRYRGRILPDSFCAVSLNADPTGRSLKEMLRDVERNILEQTLHRVDGNQTHAARILQVSPTTLHEKLKRHGLLRSSRADSKAVAG